MNRSHTQARTLQAIVNVVALAVTLIVNFLANALPLGGRTTAQISDSFAVLFVPAGYVFSIWGLIYLALTGFVVYQALPAQQGSRWVRATGWWFALTCLANTLWIIFWHFGVYPLTLLMTGSLLVGLIVIVRRLASLGRPNQSQRWFVQLPFSLYLGWASVATIANASAVFVNLGWDGRPLSPVIWTMILIFVAAALALVMLARHRDFTYAGVIVWAIVGILVKQSSNPAIVSASAVSVLAILAGALAFEWRRSTPVMAGAR
jgi:hypothetical protein